MSFYVLVLVPPLHWYYSLLLLVHLPHGSLTDLHFKILFFFQHDCPGRFWCICCFRSSVPSDLTSRASLSLSLFLFSGASNRDPCCFWCIAQSHPACKQWDKKIQCLRFCPCVQHPGLQKSFENIRLNLCPYSLVPFDWLSGVAPTQCGAKETKSF